MFLGKLNSLFFQFIIKPKIISLIAISPKWDGTILIFTGKNLFTFLAMRNWSARMEIFVRSPLCELLRATTKNVYDRHERPMSFVVARAIRKCIKNNHE